MRENQNEQSNMNNPEKLAPLDALDTAGRRAK